MQRERISTTDAPGAIGPYSQAIATGNFVFCSGQVPLEPASGALVEGDVRAQTRRALENLSGVLNAAGSSLAQVVKTTVFLVSMGDFTAMNEVYAEFFPGDPPARSTIAVAELPKGARVEIEAIALRGS
ncbi:MAG TPA: RidA family protein [Ktedonobacterales bacterium]|jgi:2-iminobutanoate/2-iminopropanoate deaminase